MDITIAEAARQLQEAQDILLIAHKSPDGDTLGSSFALYWALCGLQKRVRVECSDPIPNKYSYFLPKEMPRFEPRFYAAVDLADVQLLGGRLEPLAGSVHLCIDHHVTNTRYAACTLVDPYQAATAQLIYRVIREMGCKVTPAIADCLFTGISTDTGCFRYPNVTPETMRIAADLMEAGAQAAYINRLMFETRSRARVRAERLILDTLTESFGGRCAEIVVSKAMMAETGVREDELDGISALPRRIEGVWVSVTYHERENGYKISMRTGDEVDACTVCAALGGGGHKRAAGCFISGSLGEARERIRCALESFLPVPPNHGEGTV